MTRRRTTAEQDAAQREYEARLAFEHRERAQADYNDARRAKTWTALRPMTHGDVIRIF